MAKKVIKDGETVIADAEYPGKTPSAESETVPGHKNKRTVKKNTKAASAQIEEAASGALTTKNVTPKKRPGRQRVVSDEKLHEVLKKTGGLLGPASRALAAEGISITRQGIKRRIAGSETLQQVVEDGTQELVDEAVLGLRWAVREKQPWAVCFALKCLGKDRGYIEKQVVDIHGNIQTTVAGEIRVLRLPDNGRD